MKSNDVMVVARESLEGLTRAATSFARRRYRDASRTVNEATGSLTGADRTFRLTVGGEDRIVFSRPLGTRRFAADPAVRPSRTDAAGVEINPSAYPKDPAQWSDPLSTTPSAERGVGRMITDTSYVISHDASGSGVIADLDEDGSLSLMMENYPKKGSPLRGKAMFEELMTHFGDGVRQIRAIWVYGDNLAGFNAAVREGATLVQAAKSTWTAGRAAHYGFGRVGIEAATPRADGDFDDVIAIFRK
ncbi:MAG: hypothetical protein HOQ36_02750 [Nocardia sp.]|nr:hypothetical protein [Nocardia sp.]NUS91322.1 hypothetical protein [Nocardia sp.]